MTHSSSLIYNNCIHHVITRVELRKEKREKRKYDTITSPVYYIYY